MMATVEWDGKAIESSPRGKTETRGSVAKRYGRRHIAIPVAA
jgi:hypothetical protein